LREIYTVTDTVCDITGYFFKIVCTFVAMPVCRVMGLYALLRHAPSQPCHCLLCCCRD